MKRRATFETRSALAAPAEAVWNRIITPEGINDELRPILRMTVPPALRDLDPAGVEIGRPLGRSWILLLGVVPVDCDEIALAAFDPPRRFHERSRLISHRWWGHERTIRPLGDDACEIADRLTFEPRLPLPGGATRPALRVLFAHRHRRLRRHFGTMPA